MGTSVINTFDKMLDGSSDILKSIRGEVFGQLALGNYEQLNEYVMESLEHFSFNLVEQQFFKELRDVVNAEIKKWELNVQNGQVIDYEAFTNNLIQSLRQVQMVSISLDDDLKDLANGINNNFPLIASDDWYVRLNSKREPIVSMINKCNKDVVDVLVKLTPALASELSDMENMVRGNINKPSNVQQLSEDKPLRTQQVAQMQSERHESQQEQIMDKSNIQKPNVRVEKKPEQSAIQSITNQQLINNLLVKCAEIYKEVSSKYVSSNDPEIKSEMAKGLNQMAKFIRNLNDETFAQEVFNGYSRLNDAAQDIIYSDIIFQNVPMLKGMYEESEDISYTERKPIEPSSPKTPNPVSTYVGATNVEIEELIKQNKYFSLLHGIKKEDIMKYSGFINTGCSILLDNWYEKAASCKTYQERHDAYFELYKIYQNFRDYISMERSEQIRKQLDSIETYLNQHAKKNTDIGIRYNGNSDEQRSSSARR